MFLAASAVAQPEPTVEAPNVKVFLDLLTSDVAVAVSALDACIEPGLLLKEESQFVAGGGVRPGDTGRTRRRRLRRGDGRQ